MPTYILLIGGPGAGKGTQAEALVQRYGLPQVASGDLFRDNLKRETDLGRLAKGFMDRGELVPDDVTVAIWRRYTQGLIDTNRYFPTQQLLLLDGIPRTERQVELLEDYIDVLHVIVLEVRDPAVLVQRIQRRALIEKRPDDADPQVINTRIQEFERRTAKILKHFPPEIVTRYDAQQTPIEVLRDVLVGTAHVLKAMPHTMPSKRKVTLERPPIAPDPGR